MTDVSGKVAFITGGGSGVGFGQASVFAEAGCRVAIADIREDHLDESMEYLTGKGYEVSCLPYWIREEGQMGVPGGTSYFAVLDENFKVISIRPGA